MSNMVSTSRLCLKLCVQTALVFLLLTALLPVFFFHFPGPRFLPFSYEGMWAFTHLLWKPLRMLTDGDPALRQHVNPYLVAPLLNAALAFVIAGVELWVLRLWLRPRQRVAGLNR